MHACIHADLYSTLFTYFLVVTCTLPVGFHEIFMVVFYSLYYSMPTTTFHDYHSQQQQQCVHIYVLYAITLATKHLVCIFASYIAVIVRFYSHCLLLLLPVLRAVALAEVVAIV